MARPITYTKTCLYCGDTFIAHRSHARFCCDGCRASHANRTKSKERKKEKGSSTQLGFDHRNQPPRYSREEFGVRVLQFWSAAHHDHWLDKEIENEGPWGDLYRWKLLHVDEDGMYYYSAPRASAPQTMEEYWSRKDYWLR